MNLTCKQFRGCPEYGTPFLIAVIQDIQLPKGLRCGSQLRLGIDLRVDGRIIAQILDELIIAGELQESSKKSVLRVVRQGPKWKEKILLTLRTMTIAL